MAAVVLAGCSGGSNTAGKSKDDKEIGKDKTEQIGDVDPNEMSRLVDGTLNVDVEGAATVSFRRKVPLRVVSINNREISTLKFLSVGIHDMYPAAAGATFRIAFDLAGDFDGAGRYELPAAGQVTVPSANPDATDPNAAASGLSKVYFTYSPEGDPTKSKEAALALQSFENAVEPCELEVKDDRGESGRLECPEVVDAKGNTVSITMEWEKA
jgi:hypothetical protein